MNGMSSIQNVDFNIAMFMENVPSTFVDKVKTKFQTIFKEAVVDSNTLPIHWTIEDVASDCIKIPPQYDLVVYNKMLKASGRAGPEWIKEKFELLKQGLKQHLNTSGQAVFTGQAIFIGLNPADAEEIKDHNWGLKDSNKLSPKQVRVIPAIYNFETLQPLHGVNDVREAINKIAKEKFEELKRQQAATPVAAEAAVGTIVEEKKEEANDKTPPQVILKTETKEKTTETVKQATLVTPTNPQPQASQQAATTVKAEIAVEEKKDVTIDQNSLKEIVQEEVNSKNTKTFNSMPALEPVTITDETIDEEVKKPSRFVSIIVASLSHLITAVAVIAARILLPKAKEAGAVGIGLAAGLSSFFVMNYFRNRQVRLNESV